MAADLCCTAPRCMTPTEPIVKHQLRLASRQISAAPEEGTDSRYTSTRSEDLREIQRLFGPNGIDTTSAPPEESSYDSSTVSSKHSKLKIFFRRRLSRKFSKAKIEQADPEKIKEAKQEIRTNLLTDRGPDAGGYDSDAAVLENIEEPLTPQRNSNVLAPRGRSKHRRQSTQHQTWSGPLGPRRLSISLTPPRLSFGSRGIRRSHSMSSLPSQTDTPEPVPMRLPSFTADRDTSYTWKRGVMQSLHIDSPSNSQLIATPVRRIERLDPDHNQWPLRESVLTPDSEAPLIQDPSVFSHQASESESLLLASTPPSEDLCGPSWPKPSFERSLTSHYGSCSSSSGARPHFFMRPERRPNRTSAASVHLYSMGISRHLRSTSSFNTGGGRSHPATRAPTAPVTRSQTPNPNEKEKSTPHLVIEDLPPLPPSGRKDTASSTYSSGPSSCRSSNAETTAVEEDNIHRNRNATQQNDTSSRTTMLNTDSSRCSSLQAPKPILPDNPSVSNLSEMSTKSSKVSRFKEDFEKGENKKSKKRTSIVNLFNQLTASAVRRRKNESLESFDGPFDEPRRLQRAIALTERNDATGLLAKAIRDKQVEKTALYLKDNKLAAEREVFRQRSSSFCRPRGDSLATEEKSTESGINQGLRDWHRRSTSDTFLRPDALMPTLQPPSRGPTPRAHSTGHLTPEFTTPIFSGPASLFPEGQPSPVRRKYSLSIDPTAVAEAERRPSFQLNDIPAVLETPEPSIASKKPTSTCSSIPTQDSVDLDDPNLDLGPWSRYPSHTREQRTGSAGSKDNVKTRDFAYDINPLNITVESSDVDNDGPKSKLRRKKKTKRTGTLPKSKSLIFSRGLRNYAKMFTRSSSAEFLHYGKGHRSSVSTGGHLEHPELEMLPPVFAPMPTIPDRRGEEGEDPGLAPGKDEIEMKQMRLRRADHGHSFAEAATAGPSRLDGPADSKEDAIPAVHNPEETRRVASSPALVGRLTTADGTVVMSALTYARHYESCVYLPPSTSHSTASRKFNLIQDTSFHRITDGDAPNSPASNLIDKMLASQPTSANVSPLPSPLASPLLAPMQSIAETAKPSKSDHRGHSKSVSSVTSLRASSMDLLKTLKEAEERERQHALEDLLMKTRNSSSEERKISTDISIRTTATEDVQPAPSGYEMPGMLGSAHRTWPGAYRSSSSAVEAN